MLGTKNKTKKKYDLCIWNSEIKTSVQGKKQVCLLCLQNKSPQYSGDYHRKAAKVKKMIKAAHQESWDAYRSSIDHDVHGRQLNAYKTVKHLNEDQKDSADIK